MESFDNVEMLRLKLEAIKQSSCSYYTSVIFLMRSDDRSSKGKHRQYMRNNYVRKMCQECSLGPLPLSYLSLSRALYAREHGQYPVLLDQQLFQGLLFIYGFYFI